MAYFNKLYTTLRLIVAAIFPAYLPGRTSHSGFHTDISPEEFSAVLADPEQILLPGGNLELHFIGAGFPAAPFLLSRLKSCGFSGCKAVVTDRGILVTGRR